MKTLKTFIFASGLVGAAAFAQPVEVKCPEGTVLRESEGIVFYCVKPGGGRLDTTPYVMLHKNGKVYAKGEFRNGKREGRWEYFDEEGRPTGVTHFKDDRFDGTRIFYDAEGEVREEQNWQAGKREGEQKRRVGNEWKKRTFKSDRLIADK